MAILPDGSKEIKVDFGDLKKVLKELESSEKISKKEEKKKKTKFICPVCGCTEFEWKLEHSAFVPMGGKFYPDKIACKGHGCHIILDAKILEDLNPE